LSGGSQVVKCGQTDTTKLQSLLAILQTCLTRLEGHEAYKMKLVLQVTPEIPCFKIQNLISSTLRLFKWFKSFSTNWLQNNNIKDFRFLLQCKPGPHSSGLLCSIMLVGYFPMFWNSLPVQSSKWWSFHSEFIKHHWQQLSWSLPRVWICICYK